MEKQQQIEDYIKLQSDSKKYCNFDGIEINPNPTPKLSYLSILSKLFFRASYALRHQNPNIRYCPSPYISIINLGNLLCFSYQSNSKNIIKPTNTKKLTLDKINNLVNALKKETIDFAEIIKILIENENNLFQHFLKTIDIFDDEALNNKLKDDLVENNPPNIISTIEALQSEKSKLISILDDSSYAYNNLNENLKAMIKTRDFRRKNKTKPLVKKELSNLEEKINCYNEIFKKIMDGFLPRFENNIENIQDFLNNKILELLSEISINSYLFCHVEAKGIHYLLKQKYILNQDESITASQEELVTVNQDESITVGLARYPAKNDNQPGCCACCRAEIKAMEALYSVNIEAIAYYPNNFPPGKYKISPCITETFAVNGAHKIAEEKVEEFASLIGCDLAENFDLSLDN